MSSENPDQPRTEFQSRKKNLAVSVFFLVVALGMLAVAPVPLLNATLPPDYIIGALLILGGLVGLVVSILGIVAWRRPVWLIFSPAGVEVGRRETLALLPWSEIGLIAITDRRLDGSKLPLRPMPDAAGLRMRVLVAYPAEGATEPREGQWRLLWDKKRWTICATHTMYDRGVEHAAPFDAAVAAAIDATAPKPVPLQIDPEEVNQSAG